MLPGRTRGRIQIGADGHLLATASSDGMAQLWY
jgi:hypothetical protein